MTYSFTSSFIFAFVFPVVGKNKGKLIQMNQYSTLEGFFRNFSPETWFFFSILF